jgi:hypothetical protein
MAGLIVGRRAVPAGHRAVSQAAAHSAKSAMRGKPVEVDATQGAQTVYYRIQQATEDLGPRDFELPPQLALGTSRRLANGRQGQKNRPVAQIRPADHLLNPIELPDSEAAAAREAGGASESQTGRPDTLSKARPTEPIHLPPARTRSEGTPG